MTACSGAFNYGFQVERTALNARVRQDPFVAHDVVTTEIFAIEPSRVTPAMAELLGRAGKHRRPT
jgi:hypothetical protein